MSDLYSAIQNDIKDYVNKCKELKIKPKKDKSGEYNCYGKHAFKIDKIYNKIIKLRG